MDNTEFSDVILEYSTPHQYNYHDGNESDTQINNINIDYTCEDLISVSSEKIREEMELLNKVKTNLYRITIKTILQQ